ncbi:BZ3500_MvSof-1268-A1-R1_Chr1-3g02294 [Microbotryum saponariae]|uniref:BZ3500_MvSof-1268-A1-R1_Chr1-3g02294 protein n=1 Tax=Microbotryum saponariae TaxID=289078 RepID=A0A2X0KWY5_9BASI|nr:BZ3500_MvSof-1268-A1-R1_Chr1-3g02294 [Microbotryum saponariae]SCZ95903.1 BZ3501_MvSof-1269-A2-R1_Chr1-3g01897 [Microbotryum saponariae]
MPMIPNTNAMQSGVASDLLTSERAPEKSGAAVLTQSLTTPVPSAFQLDGHTPQATPPLSPSLAPTTPTSPAVQLVLAADLLARDSAVTTSEATIKLNGYRLTLGEVVAASRRHANVTIDYEAAEKRIKDSVDFLKSKLVTSVYGVTTGFGGSADTRTQDHLALQISLLEHQLCGVLPTSFDQFALGRGLENTLPLEVVRGAMLIRVNSLTRGHSAVRIEVLETLVKFLEQDITPVVPLRGSISASGDLSPLSYIAGAITGHPDIKVVTCINGKPEIMFAPEALKLHNIDKVVLGPKEGLGLVNGTAVSASMATMALNDSHFLALLSQALTAMTVEAMVGHAGSFDPFIHDVCRPHPGQVQVARNIRTMLSGSKLAVHHEEEVRADEDEGILRQDRYPLRCSAQFVGPAVEDIIVAHRSLAIELNSTTDNPLLDVENGMIHHGGNFQAMSVTAAMEKTRLALQWFGKGSYTQMTELVNCSMNRGLPSCLAAEDPSTSYHTKGLDIAAAAYTSELGFLANPVSTHVQPAEMSNQAINSLALISARKTAEANDVLTLLMSTHLYCALQALDLRYLEFTFRERFNPMILESLRSTFGGLLDEKTAKVLGVKVVGAMWRRLETTTSVDLVPRWVDAYSHVTSILVDALMTSSSMENPLPKISEWKKTGAEQAVTLTCEIRESYWSTTLYPTTQYLGRSKALYLFVRETLGVKARRGDVFLGKQEATIGLSVSKIYEAIKSGRINKTLVEMMM